jgi:predicted neutral ceramidase superfamily lipid hydrolase
VLVASYIHLGVFGAIGVSALVWFGGFAVATAMLAFLSYRALWLGRV